MASCYATFARLFCCCCLLLAAPTVRAQFLWQKAVGTASRSETAEFMVSVAGGFVTLGKYSSLAQNRTGLFLSKVNYTGDTLWTRRCDLARAGAIYPKGLFADAAGNLVASAVTFGPPATPNGPPPPSEGRLVKFSAQGDTLWTRAVSALSNAALSVPVLGNDGNYVVIGDYGTSLPILFKFSPAGALLWAQPVIYDNTHIGYLQNLVAVPNGYFIISSPNLGNLKSKYITVNEQGTYLFERPGRFYYPDQLTLDSQGNILACGGDLLKLTVQGDSLWVRLYQQFGQMFGVARLVELRNGRYLVAGTRYNGPTRDVGMAVVDRNGTVLRDTLLVRYNSDENVAGVALTPAGNYVLALGASVGPIGLADQVLFGYHNWDRLLLAAAARPTPAAQLTAYPNPTPDDLTLEATDAHPLRGHWVLYNSLGRAVQTGSLSGLPRCRLSLAAQPAGLYLLRVADAAQRTTQHLPLHKQ